MFRLLLSILILIGSANSGFSQQQYKTALGLRINGGAGITARHFLSGNQSIEGIMYTRWGGLNFTGLYNVNFPVFTEPGFNFFIGGGGHIGFWDADRNPWWDEDEKGNKTVVGLDGQIGLEYVFDDIPLNLALDWKPAINFIGSSNFYGGDFGLSVRYAFK